MYILDSDSHKITIIAKKSMCRKIPFINPGDIIVVDIKGQKNDGSLVIVFDNENCWIDKYSKDLEHFNTYLISKVIMNS